jgi:hypothetical protein
MSALNINLELLMRLMQELESSVNDAAVAKIRDPKSSDYKVELAKALGLASLISQEAILLVADIANIFSTSESNSDEQVIKSILLNKSKSSVN